MKIIRYNITTFAIKSNWVREAHYTHAGWGNGYVTIPPNHPCYKMHYDDISSQYSHIDVNGGLTYSGNGINLCHGKNLAKNLWIIGFDTCHFGDSMEKWPDEASVLAEAERLKQQMLMIDDLTVVPKSAKEFMREFELNIQIDPQTGDILNFDDIKLPEYHAKNIK